MPKTKIKLPQRIHNSRITKVKLKSDLINGKRCHLCCTKLVENRNKFKNSSKRVFNVSISNSTFGLFLASHILSMNKDLFDNENEENHRFSVNSNFKICRKCGGRMKNHFSLKKLAPKKPYSDWLQNNPENLNQNLDLHPSDYFSQSELEPRNSTGNFFESDSFPLRILKADDLDEEGFSHGENHDNSEVSLILNESSQESFLLRHDEESSDEYVPLSFFEENQESDSIECGSSESDDGEEILVNYYWRPKKAQKVKKIILESFEINKCSICDSESEKLERLSLSQVHGILERENIHLKQWEKILICELCYFDGQLADSCKELLNFLPGKTQMKKRVLLGNFSQDYCDMIREQKRDEANMSS